MTISKRNIYLYNAAQFLFALVFTIPIWIVYYQTRISIAQISFLVAFQYAIQLLLEMPTGALSDLIGRKTCIALGYLLWSLSFLAIVLSQGFWPLIGATILAGLAESLLSGSLEAILYDSLKQDKVEDTFSKVSAQSGVIFQLGLASATFMGGYLYGIHWSLPYLACVIANFGAFVIALQFEEPLIDSEKFSLQSYVRQMKEGTIHAFANEQVAAMSLFYIVVSAITWTNNLYFFDFMLVELAFSDTQRSTFAAAIRIFNVVIIATLLRNERIFTKKRAIILFPFMMLLCFLPGIFFKGYWALPFISGAVLAGTARWIVLTRYTNEFFESKYRATAISALSMIVCILFVGITFISGPIIEVWGVRGMYTLLGVATLFTAVPLAWKVLPRDTK